MIGHVPNSVRCENCGSVARTPEIAYQGRTSADCLPCSVQIVIVMAVTSVDHDLGAVPVIPISISLADLGAVPVIPAQVPVPMPVSLAYLYPNAADPDIGALREDYRFVDSDRGTGKCRYGEEWNSTERKNSFLHGTLLVWDVRRPDTHRMRGCVRPSLYRIDRRRLDKTLVKELGPAVRIISDQGRLNCVRYHKKVRSECD
jgi:hypothetical protein